MNLKTGYPYSLIKNGLLFEYPKLEKNLKTDVVVLGAGISGALVAHYLIKEGVDCTVIDARSIGLGSTCASTGLLQYEIDTPLVKLASMIGLSKAARAYALCSNAIDKLSTLASRIGLDEFKHKSSLFYAVKPKELSWLKEEFELRKRFGFAVRFLAGATIKKDFGFDSPGGLLSEHAADTNAYLFTHYLHQYNLSRGLVVYDRSPISSIRHGRSNVVLKTKNGFHVQAKKMVYATGYEVGNFINKPIVKLKTTFATISEARTLPPPYWKRDSLIWNTRDPYLYMRTTQDNRIIVGGRDVKTINSFRVNGMLATKKRDLKKDFNSIFPAIPFIPEFTWAGVFGSTSDGLPYIGEYKNLPNSYFALGFGGNGITFSQVAGEIVAALIKGRKHIDAGVFSFERPG